MQIQYYNNNNTIRIKKNNEINYNTKYKARKSNITITIEIQR